jgi:hypothetical protein
MVWVNLFVIMLLKNSSHKKAFNLTQRYGYILKFKSLHFRVDPEQNILKYGSY